MYYKFIIRNKQILLRILFLTAFSFFLKYATHNGYKPHELLGAYQMYMGGIFLINTTDYASIDQCCVIHILRSL